MPLLSVGTVGTSRLAVGTTKVSALVGVGGEDSGWVLVIKCDKSVGAASWVGSVEVGSVAAEGGFCQLLVGSGVSSVGVGVKVGVASDCQAVGDGEGIEGEIWGPSIGGGWIGAAQGLSKGEVVGGGVG